MEQPVYISSACNATVSAADWGKNNLICYASCNAIFIYNPKVRDSLIKLIIIGFIY